MSGRTPTGKRIEFQFLKVVRLENDRIVVHNTAVDWLAIPTQLGLFAMAPQPRSDLMQQPWFRLAG